MRVWLLLLKLSHSFRTENKPKPHEKVCKNNFFLEL